MSGDLGQCSYCLKREQRVFVVGRQFTDDGTTEGLRCLSCHPTLSPSDHPPETPPTALFRPGFICGRRCENGTRCRQGVGHAWKPCILHGDEPFPGGERVSVNADRASDD